MITPQLPSGRPQPSQGPRGKGGGGCLTESQQLQAQHLRHSGQFSLEREEEPGLSRARSPSHLLGSEATSENQSRAQGREEERGGGPWVIVSWPYGASGKVRRVGGHHCCVH